MARYFDDFTGYATGNWTSNPNWQPQILNGANTLSFNADGTAQHGRYMRISAASTSGSRVLGYNPANGANDVDILTQFRTDNPNNTTSGRWGIAYARFSGTSEAATKGYVLYLGTFSNTRGIGIVEDSTGATVNWFPYNVNANTWYWVRFKAVGTALYAKVWTGTAASEPASWNTSGTNTTQTSGSYSGVGTYRPGNLDYGWFSIGTGVDTPPVPIDNQTADQVGNVRVTSTVDKTQIGNVRITQSTSRIQSGNVRITASTSKPQLGNVRITATATKTQTGNVRVTRTLDNTQTGNVRITATTSRNQLGSVWIGPPPTNRTQVGNVRITQVVSNSQVGNVRIQLTPSKPQLGNVRIQLTQDRIQSGNVRIANIYSRSQTGNIRIAGGASQYQTGNVRIEQTFNKNQSGNVRIATGYNRLQVGNVRISVTPSKTQTGNVRIQLTQDRNQVGSVVIAREYLRNQTGNVRIVAGRSYNDKPVVQIESEKPKMGSYTTRPTGMAESVTGIVTSDKIKPVLRIESFESNYIDNTVLCDDPVALCDDPLALAGQLIEVGNKPDALRVVVEKGKIQVNKEKVDTWQISQPTTPALQTSLEAKPSLRTTTPRVIIKSIEKSKPLLNE